MRAGWAGAPAPTATGAGCHWGGAGGDSRLNHHLHKEEGLDRGSPAHYSKLLGRRVGAKLGMRMAASAAEAPAAAAGAAEGWVVGGRSSLVRLWAWVVGGASGSSRRQR